ncbi:MAG: 6,7-dimethyl-8-ribityllumazine synthase [Planctomycetota bacterium]
MSLGQTDRPQPLRLRPHTGVAAVVSTYHEELTGGMFESARETLLAAGLAEDRLARIDVPGAYELPVVAQRLAEREDVDAVLCFGLVLKGETEHDRYIAGAVADGLMRISLETRKPVLFGVLTCGTLEQAQARARRASAGGLDKGHEVARAAILALDALERTGGALRGAEANR